MAFNGFRKETIEFLWGIRLNNDRAWYQEHKDECRTYLTGPMNELANRIFEAFEEKRPDLQLTVHMSRIYRDARRLYGKGPYRDYLWFSLHDARYLKWSGSPSFWFDIGVERWSYGLGCWDDSQGLMKKVRAKILADPAGILELDRMLKEQGEFTVSGEEYKKQYRDCPVPELSHWYCKKQLAFEHSETVGPAVTEAAFGDRIAEGLLSLLPVYDYFLPMSLEENEDEDNG